MNKSAGIFDLPERLSREQANPFCYMLCKKGEECHGDCDCNVEVQTAWSEFLDIIKRQQWKGEE